MNQEKQTPEIEIKNESELTIKNHKKREPKPLTLAEIHKATQKRLSAIHKEFSSGFEFIKNYPKSVTFFGSARAKEGTIYYENAKILAEKIVSELGYTVVSGGGPGIMEAASRGAFEMGGSSVGLNIELPHEQTTNPYTTDHMDFYYFFTRKVCLSFSAEAYVIFPGGFGTMDETFELITLMQTYKIISAPIILVGSDFWKEFDNFVKNSLLSREMVSDKDLTVYTIEDDHDKILEIIKNAPVRNGVRYRNSDKRKKHK